jgi:hypothetical protein
VIIDTNACHKFTQPPHKDVVPVATWLLKSKKGMAVMGGRLKREWDGAGEAFRRFLRVLRQAGRLLAKDAAIVDAEFSNRQARFIKPRATSLSWTNHALAGKTRRRTETKYTESQLGVQIPYEPEA